MSSSRPFSVAVRASSSPTPASRELYAPSKPTSYDVDAMIEVSLPPGASPATPRKFTTEAAVAGSLSSSCYGA